MFNLKGKCKVEIKQNLTKSIFYRKNKKEKLPRRPTRRTGKKNERRRSFYYINGTSYYFCFFEIFLNKKMLKYIANQDENMENNTLLQFFKEHFDAIAIFATFFVGYFQIRTMMREEVKHFVDPLKEMMSTQIARLDAHMLDGNRKWEANERKWEANERRREANERKWDTKWDANERKWDTKWDAITAKMDSKWDCVNQRLDNTYNIIVEEIRSRK